MHPPRKEGFQPPDAFFYDRHHMWMFMRSHELETSFISGMLSNSVSEKSPEERKIIISDAS